MTFAYIADPHDDHARHAHRATPSVRARRVRAATGRYNKAFRRSSSGSPTMASTSPTRYSCSPSTRATTSPAGPPLNPGCDGVTTPCQYTPGTVGANTVGEQDAELGDALKRETGNTTPFDIHFDDAHNVCPRADRNDPVAERAVCAPARARHGQADAPERADRQHRPGDAAHRRPDRGRASCTWSRRIRCGRRRSRDSANPDYFFEQDRAACPTARRRPDVQRSAPASPGTTETTTRRSRRRGSGTSGRRCGTSVRPSRSGRITQMSARRCSRSSGCRTTTPRTDDSSRRSPIGRGSPFGLRGDELRSFERLAARYKQIEAPFGRFGHDSEIVSTHCRGERLTRRPGLPPVRPSAPSMRDAARPARRADQSRAPTRNVRWRRDRRAHSGAVDRPGARALGRDARPLTDDDAAGAPGVRRGVAPAARPGLRGASVSSDRVRDVRLLEPGDLVLVSDSCSAASASRDVLELRRSDDRRGDARLVQ